MARRGRPRKSGAREKNGRLQRPTLAQLMDADHRQRMAETAVVAAQPHRAWAPDPSSPWLASALGRFCIRYKVRSELYDAASEWTAIYRRWRAASTIPDPLHSSSLGSGLGPSEGTIAAWWRDIERVERALLEGYGQVVLLAVRHLCLDDEDLPHEAAAEALIGLRVVAVQMGRLPEGAHPFVEGRMAA